jgi:uncharacterized membrane-anchored protein
MPITEWSSEKRKARFHLLSTHKPISTMNKKLILPAFILMALAQIYVPASLIFQKEQVMAEGVEYRFKIYPLDPNGPYRGKYFTLSFNANAVKVDSSADWASGETVFVELMTDSAGYAGIADVSRSVPSSGNDYVKATVDYVITDTLNTLYVKYPFDRYYIDMPDPAESAPVNTSAIEDSTQVTYALVVVNDGDALVKEIFVDEQPVKEWIKEQRRKAE